MVCRNGGVSSGTSGSDKVASVRIGGTRYLYHCVCARTDLLWVVQMSSLSEYPPCPKVRNLGCVVKVRCLLGVDAGGGCRKS